MSNWIIKKSHVDEFNKEFQKALEIGLTKCGMKCKDYAKLYCRPHGPSTGDLRDHITYMVEMDEQAVYIGNEKEKYAIYFELGTGIFAAGGRPTPWHYQDIHGQWHTTRGQRAKPYLKPALKNHANEYRTILKDAFK